MGGCLGPRDPFFKWPKFMAYKGWGDPNYLLTGMILQVVSPPPGGFDHVKLNGEETFDGGVFFLEKIRVIYRDL